MSCSACTTSETMQKWQYRCFILTLLWTIRLPVSQRHSLCFPFSQLVHSENLEYSHIGRCILSLKHTMYKYRILLLQSTCSLVCWRWNELKRGYSRAIRKCLQSYNSCKALEFPKVHLGVELGASVYAQIPTYYMQKPSRSISTLPCHSWNP